MGLFSGLFGKKEKKKFISPDLGEFSLVFSNGSTSLWTAESNEIFYVVRGTHDRPFEEELAFLKKAPDEITLLDEKIDIRFKQHLAAGGHEINYNHWKDRFKINNIQVMEINNVQNQWYLRLQDLQRKKDVYILKIEGNALVKLSLEED